VGRDPLSVLFAKCWSSFLRSLLEIPYLLFPGLLLDSHRNKSFSPLSFPFGYAKTRAFSDGITWVGSRDASSSLASQFFLSGGLSALCRTSSGTPFRRVFSWLHQRLNLCGRFASISPYSFFVLLSFLFPICGCPSPRALSFPSLSGMPSPAQIVLR